MILRRYVGFTRNVEVLSKAFGIMAVARPNFMKNVAIIEMLNLSIDQLCFGLTLDVGLY